MAVRWQRACVKMLVHTHTYSLTHKQFTHHPPSSISTQLVCLSSKGIEESNDGSGGGHDGQEVEDGHGGIMTIDCE